RSRIDEVRILGGFRQNRYVDFIATDFAGEGSGVRQRCDDIKFCLRRTRACDNCGKDQRSLLHELKLVSAMCAENEFALKKDRLDFPWGEEKVFLEEILVVLQSDFRKLSWVPCEIGAKPPAWLPVQVIGKHGILHVDIVPTNTSDPSFFKSPQHLRIESPIVKRFGDRERIIRPMT